MMFTSLYYLLLVRMYFLVVVVVFFVLFFFLTSLYIALTSIYSNELNKVHRYKCRFNKVKVF